MHHISDPTDPHFDRALPGETVPCPGCGRPIEECRVWLGAQTCAACANHKGVIRP